MTGVASTGPSLNHPTPPTSLVATPSNGEISIAFTQGSNGGSSITDYEYSLNSGAYESAGTTVSPVVITGLTNGTLYTVTLKAKNINGLSSASSSVSATPATIPDTPTNLVATPSNTQISIAFTPGSDGETSITDYEYSLNGGAYTSAGRTASPVVITGLTNGTSYTIRLKAVNSVGSSSASSSVSATPITIPDAPTNVQAISNGSSAIVSWSVPENNGGSAITQYTVYNVNTDETYSTSNTSLTIPDLITATNENSVTYSFYVTAFNGSLNSENSSTSNNVTPISAPTNLTVLRGVNGNVTLSWVPSVSTIIEDLNYQVSFLPFEPESIIGEITTANGIMTSVIQGLSSDIFYDFTITASSSVENSTASISSQQVIFLSALTNITAVSGVESATISWENDYISDEQDTITRYVITSSPGSITSTINDGTVSNGIITGLTNGTSYTFTVTAYNDYSTVTSSSSASIIPIGIPSDPQNVSVSSTPNTNTVVVSWSAPADNGGASLTYTIIGSNGATKTTSSLTTNFTGLTPGSSYTFDIVANNGTFFSSVTSNSITPTNVPSAPTITNVVEGLQCVTVYWNPSSNNNGKSITSYTIYGAGSDTIVNVSELTGQTAPYQTTISGLTQGVLYQIYMEATNENGNSIPSASSSYFTPFGPPYTAATNIIASRGNSQVSLVWNPPSNSGNSTIDYYKITYYPSDNTSNSQIYQTPNGETSATITNLTNGTEYTFNVTTHNIHGLGPTSNPATATPATVPNAPTSLDATPLNGQISIAFTPGSDGGSSITNYEYSLNSGAYTSTGRTASPVVISGLTNGTSYTIRLKAVNSVGSSLASTSISATPKTIPNAPTSLVATPSNAQISIGFTPGSNGGSSITDYKYSLNGGAYTSAGTTVSPVVITGLTNGTSYSIILEAVNSVGSSSASSSVSAIPNLVPNAPTSVSATSSNNSATVTWTAPETNAGTIDNYIVSWQANGSTQNQTVSNSSTQTTIANLINGQSYVFYVSASNNIGSTISTTGSSSVVPNIAPLVPSSVTATTGQNTSSTVSWSPNTSNGAYIDSYTVSYKPSTSSDFTIFRENISNSTSSLNITGLTNNVSYVVKVTAINNKGTASTDSSSFTPDIVPRQVGSLSASVPSNTTGQVNLSWAQATTTGSPITSYSIRNASSNVDLATVDASETITTLTDLPTGIPISFKIAAVNNKGLSSFTTSNSVTPTGLPYAPTGIAVTSKVNAAIITWNEPSNTGGLPITSYKVTSYDENNVAGQYKTTSSRSALISALQGGASYTFSVTATNSLGTGPASSPSSPKTINYSCFHSSSKILALKDDEEKYIPISELKKGDLIKTYKHEYVKIFAVSKSTIKHDFSNDRVPEHLYILPKSTFHELTDDLILTGYHSILVDDMNKEQCEQIAKENKSNNLYLTDDKYRLFCYLEPNAILYNDEVGEVEIWHIALENESKTRNYGIYANGLLVETLPICMIK